MFLDRPHPSKNDAALLFWADSFCANSYKGQMIQTVHMMGHADTTNGPIFQTAVVLNGRSHLNDIYMWNALLYMYGISAIIIVLALSKLSQICHFTLILSYYHRLVFETAQIYTCAFV